MENAREFANRLLELLRNERHAMAEFLIALAEFDRRNLYRELGHATLFSFLRVELKLSAGAAQYRKTAAELVQRFPEVEAALRDGRVCFSAVIQIAKVLTPENCAEVLPRFFGLSARDATFVAVSIRPVESAPRREVLVPSRPAVAARTVEVAATGSPDAAPLLAFRTSEVATDEAAPAPVGAQEPASLPPVPTRTTPPKPSSFEPLDGEHGRMHLNVSMRLHRKIEEAKHGHPGATLEEVFEAALDALLTQRAKRRGIGVKPRKTPRPAKPETITAELTRALFARSGGRCEWRFESGERCNSPVLPEQDHVTPSALGGPTTLEGMRILCRPHNDLAARRVFGDRWMNRFTGKGRRRRDTGSAT
jgi:hypothetical protein